MKVGGFCYRSGKLVTWFTDERFLFKGGENSSADVTRIIAGCHFIIQTESPTMAPEIVMTGTR